MPARPERGRGRRPPYVRDGVVLGAAVGAFGVTFGVLAAGAGLSVAKAAALSLLVFTGASQFSAVGVAAAGGGTPAALGGALLLAARNGVYGMAVAPVLKGRLPHRLLAAQLVIDETTAMATAQPDPARARGAFWATGISVFVCWNVGTVVGAVGGRALGDPAALGLDAAFPAAFVALLVPHLGTRAGRLAAGLGALFAALTLPVVPAGVPVLAAALAAPVAFGVLRRLDGKRGRAGGADGG